MVHFYVQWTWWCFENNPNWHGFDKGVSAKSNIMIHLTLSFSSMPRVSIEIGIERIEEKKTFFFAVKTTQWVND